jgi:hypothetical protein
MNTGRALSYIHAPSDVQTHPSSDRMSPGSHFDRLTSWVDDRLHFIYISNKCIEERRRYRGTAIRVGCDADSSALYFSCLFQLGFHSPAVISAVVNQQCWCAEHRVVALSQRDHQSYSATRSHHTTCLVFGVIVGKHPCLCLKFSHTLYTV